MTTDESINHEQDQAQLTEEADHSTVGDKLDVLSEIAQLKKGNKTLSEQLKKVTKALEDRASEEVVEESDVEEDLDTKISKTAERIVAQKEWQRENQALIDNLSEENKEFFELKAKTIGFEDALAVALHREGVSVQTKEHLHARSGSLHRDVEPSLTESEKQSGITKEMKAKYGEKAKQIQVIL